MRRLASAILLACALCPPGPAQSGLPLIQPDAGLVFGVEWRRILESRAGAQFAEQIGKSDLAKFPGFESMQDTLLRDIDSIVIAAPASALNKSDPQSAGLLVVKGRFDVVRLRSLLGVKNTPSETYRAVELFGGPKNATANSPAGKNSLFGVLDANTLIAGDRAQVHGAIDRVKMGRLTPSRGILAGVADLAANNDVWLVAAIPPNATKDMSQPMGQMLANVTSTEIGMSFREGLAMRMTVRAKDEPSATQVLQMMQGLISMAALSQSQEPQALDMLKKIELTSEGSQVKLALTLDQAQLEKMMKDAQTARANPTPRPSPANNGIRPPESPKPGTIRITGLDDGVGSPGTELEFAL